MATRLEHTQNGTSMEIEALGTFHPADPQIVAFQRALDGLRVAAKLQTFALLREAPVGSEERYTYMWATKDGRTWINRFRIGNGLVLVNFEVADYFQEAEYLPSLQLRQNVLAIIKAFVITKIEATF